MSRRARGWERRHLGWARGAGPSSRGGRAGSGRKPRRGM